MFVIKANSTGKSKPERLTGTEMSSCSTCPKSSHTNAHKREFERPQAIKVKYLLEQSEGTKSAKKDSVRKKILPERLGPSSSVKKTRTGEKPNGTNTFPRSGHSFKRVQRYLNFNTASVDSPKHDNEDGTQSIERAQDKTNNKTVSVTASRKSLLLPPNTIKDRHLGKPTKTPSRCSRISEVPNEILVKRNVNSAVEKHTGIPEHVIISNETRLQVQSNSKHNEHNLGATNERRTCMQSELVNSESDSNAEHESLIHLERYLQDLLNETEKNVHKLRSALTCVRRLLPAEEKRQSTFTCNSMIDKEVQVTTCCKTVEYSDEQLKAPPTDGPKLILPSTQVPNKHTIVQNHENNKENENVDVRLLDTGDGSFLELEKQLNIAHALPMQHYSAGQTTPTVTKHKQRSLREYMALKSSMSFLQTPDGRKFNSLCQANNADKNVRNLTYISTKLFTDLHNLYSDSPEC